MSQSETHPFSPSVITAKLQALFHEFGFSRFFSLGQSLLAQPLAALSIGCGRRLLLFVGGHHGCEYLTSALLCQFAEELCCAAASGERRFGFYVREVLERRTLILVPSLNPDGIAIAQSGIQAAPSLESRLLAMNGGSDFSRWKANARGVDLNHNYDYGFAAYKALEAKEGIQPGPTRYAGEYPESEPETAALCRFIEENAACLSLILSFHSQGEVIYCRDTPRNRPGGRFLARASGYRLLSPEGLAAFGGLCDWSSTLNIPSYTVEIGKGENPLPHSECAYLYAGLREMLFTSLLYF